MRAILPFSTVRHPSESWGLGRRSTNALDASFRWHDGFGFWHCLIAIALLLCASTPARANPDYANTQLADSAKEAEATRLMHGLRCIQCQGQSIADSDAEMASTMRAEVRRQIDAGQSSDSVRQWMIQRYGEWVSFEPAVHGAALALWIAPLLIFGIALAVAASMFRKRKS